MSRLCTICARGGSKGVPGKNLRTVGGRPLIAHSVVQARDSGLFDVIAVSSDSAYIREAAMKAGATLEIDRPASLADDRAGKVPAILHALRTAEEITDRQFDFIVDLDVTSPLRDISDIVEAVRMVETSDAPNLITAAPARRSPYFNLVERDSSGQVRLSKPSTILRRQDVPECFDMNASIYVWRRESLLADNGLFNPGTLLMVMPEERSHDIDTELDLAIVDFLFQRRGPDEE